MTESDKNEKESGNNKDLQLKVQQNKATGTIHLSNTKIVELVISIANSKAISRIPDIHSSVLSGARLKASMNGYLSKTDHKQCASVIDRYLGTIRDFSAQQQGGLDSSSLYSQSVAAIAEARKLHKIADDMAEQYQKENSRGNVEFVESLQ